jgi:xanthine/uracil permease
MNFKPSTLKTSISFLAGIFANYLLAGTVRIVCMSNPAEGPGFSCPQPRWLDFAFDPVPIIASIIVVLLVYLIWSFIQKKSK